MALYLYILSWFASLLHIILGTLAIAAGLYYLAELVEEYVSYAAKLMRITILSTIGLYILLFLCEDFPNSVIVCGVLSQIFYLSIFRTFPFFNFSSLPFILGCVFFLANHYLAFTFFSSNYYHISEILAYFTLFVWLVPFGFFISLSANDNILPTQAETTPLLSNNQDDFVTGYFSKKGKRYGLLNLLSYIKEECFPTKTKKSF